MNKTIFGLTVSLISLGAGMVSAKDMSVAQTAIKGAPAHLIPMSASQIAEARVHEILSEKLSSSLALGTADLPVEADLAEIERISAMADIPVVPEPVETVQIEPAPEEGADMVQLASFPAEEESPFEDMTEAQMKLLVMMAMAVKDPQRVADLLGNEPREDRPFAEPDNLIADADIMLRGWNVRMDGFGTTHLYQEGMPNSSIELEEGIVIGALGAVTEIRQIAGEVHVFFESGDSMSGEVSEMTVGIPPLPDMTETISTKGSVVTDEYFSLSSPQNSKPSFLK